MSSTSVPREAGSVVDRLRARWAAGHASLGGWLVSPDPYMAELMARCGFDEVTIDLQHSTIEPSEVAVLSLAITAGGAAPLVRLPPYDPVVINRALDLGAAGVIVAMVESADEAAAVVAACRYPPHGTRSAGAVRAKYTLGRGDLDGIASALRFVMIETMAGLEEAEAIAAVAGLDGIYVGPGDLGISLGLPPAAERTDEERRVLEAAIDRVLQACQQNGIVPAIHMGDGATAAAWVRRGFRMVTVVADIGLLVGGATRELGVAVREAGDIGGGERPSRL